MKVTTSAMSASLIVISLCMTPSAALNFGFRPDRTIGALTAHVPLLSRAEWLSAEARSYDRDHALYRGGRHGLRHEGERYRCIADVLIFFCPLLYAYWCAEIGSQNGSSLWKQGVQPQIQTVRAHRRGEWFLYVYIQAYIYQHDFIVHICSKVQRRVFAFMRTYCVFTCISFLPKWRDM
jgi:hypothetical protein